MENKLKLERFFCLIIWKQIFQLLTLKEAIKDAKNEMEESGKEVKFTYSEDYVSRKLQQYRYLSYKTQLLRKLAPFEAEISPTIAEII